MGNRTEQKKLLWIALGLGGVICLITIPLLFTVYQEAKEEHAKEERIQEFIAHTVRDVPIPIVNTSTDAVPFTTLSINNIDKDLPLAI